MRQKNYIHQLSSKDVRLLDALRMCNHLSPEQARTMVSRYRLDNYIKQGVIKHVYHVANSRTIEAFALTAKGRQWINRNVTELNGKSFYSADTAIRHNIRLANEYLRIKQEQPNAEFYTERDIREYFCDLARERSDGEELLRALCEGNISVPDLTYRPAGSERMIAVEVITSNYSQPQIEAKEAFEAATGIEIQYFRY